MELRKISKSSVRFYSGYEKMPKVVNGLGVAIISTSKGLMTDNEAREKKLGGEVICYIW